ncbi:hypothetical protein SK128_027859 [Halocaridina rubra]|uniref:Homeobox domain-containing protein n=1 Tax=Halocaridina rubra TaxID=373956 RepID=A0AAN8WHW2_HALRR
MLTQLELLTASGTAGNDEDSGMSVSPLDGLTDYPIEQTEFEYFESTLGSDSYYDVSPPHDIQDSLPPPPSLTTSTVYTSSSLYDTSLSNGSSVVLPKQEDDMKSFQDDGLEAFQNEDIKPLQDISLKSFKSELQPLSEVLEASQNNPEGVYGGSMKFTEDRITFEDDSTTYSGFSNDVFDSNSMTAADFNLGSLYDTFDANLHANIVPETRTTFDEGNGKGKIGPLQRRALDSIFSVTEKPSRGLVLHIAAELGLHHLTVKNFFSNGRRRLRRAAARLNDPERTRRENERRKEKRRLAAKASAALSSGENKSNNNSLHSTKVLSPRSSTESPSPKETPFISLERRALMEKLADKVQRSKAQKSLANDLGMLHSTTSTDYFRNPQELIAQPPNDILSQASQDILSQSTQGLLSEFPHDFLVETTPDLSQSSASSLLNPNTDPWNFF